MKKYIFLLSCILASVVFCENTKENANIEKHIDNLPTSFHEIGLGMSLDEVKERLKMDESFAYRGDRDVSLLQSKNRSVIESEGVYFIKRGSFQFYNEKLYTIIVQMNPENIDYYSIYSTLIEKYGEPGLVDQKKAVWENESIRLVLERPLSIKYIDATTFNEIVASRNKKTAVSDETRANFVNAF